MDFSSLLSGFGGKSGGGGGGGKTAQSQAASRTGDTITTTNTNDLRPLLPWLVGGFVAVALVLGALIWLFRK